MPEGTILGSIKWVFGIDTSSFDQGIDRVESKAKEVERTATSEIKVGIDASDFNQGITEVKSDLAGLEQTETSEIKIGLDSSGVSDDISDIQDDLDDLDKSATQEIQIGLDSSGVSAGITEIRTDLTRLEQSKITDIKVGVDTTGFDQALDDAISGLSELEQSTVSEIDIDADTTGFDSAYSDITTKLDDLAARAEVLKQKTEENAKIGVEVNTKGLDTLDDSAGSSQVKLKSLSREVSTLGSSLASMGGVAMIAGMSLGDSGLGQGLMKAGTGMSMFGGMVSTAGSISRVFGVTLQGQLIPALKAAGIAAYGALGPIGLLALAITGAVAGGYLLYRAFKKAEDGAHDLEQQTKDLNDELSTLNYVQEAYNSKLDDAESAYDGLTDSVKDYDDAIKDARDDLERLKDINDDITGNALDQEEAYLDLQDAIKEWQTAAEENASGVTVDGKIKVDDSDVRRAAINAAQAQERYNKLIKDGNELQEEKTDLGDEESVISRLTKLEEDRATAAQDMIKAEEKVLDLKKQEAKIADEIRSKDFQLKLIEWQKSGVKLTDEERQMFGSVDWMREAMSKMPETYKTGYMDFWEQMDVNSKQAPAYGKEMANPYYMAPESEVPTRMPGINAPVEYQVPYAAGGPTTGTAESLQRLIESSSQQNQPQPIQQTNTFSIVVKTVEEANKIITAMPAKTLSDILKNAKAGGFVPS